MSAGDEIGVAVIRGTLSGVSFCARRHGETGAGWVFGATDGQDLDGGRWLHMHWAFATEAEAEALRAALAEKLQ